MPASRRTPASPPFPQVVTAACAVAAVVLCMGCSATAPRFRSNDSGSGQSADEEARYASRIRTEESTEDDRKVDVQSIGKRMSARPDPASKYSNITPKGINRDRFLLEVVSLLGVPYEYGGSSREGIDCSAFTSWVYSDVLQKQLPRSAAGQYEVGAMVSKENLEFGDLVFFNTTGRAPSHVGIYIEDDIFAHASVTSGVTLSSLESSYYRNRFVGARRVVQEE